MWDDGPSEAEYQEWAMLCEEDPDPEPISRDSIWITKEKQRVPIYAMTDTHLLNTIRVLRGKSPIGTTVKFEGFIRRGWLNAMANEAYARGLSIDDLDNKDPVHE